MNHRRATLVRSIITIALVVPLVAGCRLFPPHQTAFDAVRDLSGSLAVYPEAEGFGSSTRAGRGGEIIRVTNLSGRGVGSLRAALQQEGARIVVFEVGGTIELDSPITVHHPFLTVAGQTAPDPGITLIGSGIVISTHDVLVQHIRSRPGDGTVGTAPENRDGISVVGSPDGLTDVYNVVVDHCSISWAIDEGVSTWYDGVRDVTFSYNIIAENLSESRHPKGEHSKGLLIGDHSRRISVIGNLFAHNMRRNPLLKGDTSSLVANNVIYNPGTEAIGFSDPEWSGRSIATIVDNLFIPGPDTAGSEFVRRGIGTSSGIEIFLTGNTVRNGTLVEFVAPPSIASVLVNSAPVWVEPFEPVTVSQLEGVVLSMAGARPVSRDLVDERIVESVRNRTGMIIDSQNDVGGHPASTPTSISLSIPENPHGDDDADGYTNVEEWLHSLAADLELN